MPTNSKASAHKRPVSLASPELVEQDFELSRQFQSFSAELLRLSLLALGVIGFLVVEVVLRANTTGYIQRMGAEKASLAFSIFVLASAAAAAMGHRYFAVNSLACEIRLLRIRDRLKESANQDDRDGFRLQEEQETRDLERNLKNAHHWLKMSGIMLGIGVYFIAISFIVVVFGR